MSPTQPGRPLDTKKAGTLQPGDGFRFPGEREVFKFLSHRTENDHGGDHVFAYGGSKNPDGVRQFRAFRTDVVVAKALRAKYPEHRKGK